MSQLLLKNCTFPIKERKIKEGVFLTEQEMLFHIGATAEKIKRKTKGFSLM